jgi:hypothetical protein
MQGKTVDKEEELYFRHLTDMFRTEGWKIITEELAADIVNLSHIESIKDEQELNYRKGQLLVMKNMLNLEATLEAAKEDSGD